MAIHILHVLDSLGRGGLENGVVNLIRELDSSQFEHTVVALRRLGENASRLPESRVSIRRLASEGAGRSRYQIRDIARTIREVRPDVVHSRNWGAIEAVVAAKLAGKCAVVHSEHGYDTESARSEPLRRVLFRRAAFELADQVCAVSDELRRVHARRTGFNPGRISVIHNGVDTRRFRPDPEVRSRVRRELGIGDLGFCIGCVANFSPVKDHPTLLEAVGLFARECPDWRLVLIGDGPGRAGIEEIAASDPALGGRVLFLGASDRVPELLNALDAHVLPSLIEGISNALLESMASGVPPIATATGGNPEVVEDGRSGLLTPIGDARAIAEQLTRLWRKPDWRATIAAEATRRIHQEFSLPAMVQQYGRLYAGLSASRRTAAAYALSVQR
jgi:sugar transferase (PEP-CTERM/EpsH1 system associated)